MIKLSSFSFLSSLIFGLGFSIATSRLLGVSDKGVFFNYQVIALVAATIIFAPISQVLFELLRDYVLDINKLLNILVASILTLIIFSFLSCIALSVFFDLNFILIFTLLIGQGLMIGLLEFGKFRLDLNKFLILNSIQGFLPLAILLLAFFSLVEFSYFEAIISTSIGYLLVSFFGLLLVKNSKNPQSKSNKIKPRERYLSILFVKTLGSIVNYTDRIIMISFLDNRSMGLISVCYNLETVSSKFYQFVANTKLNFLSKNDNTKSKFIDTIAIVCAFLGLSATYFLGSLIIKFVFGIEYIEAYEYLLIIILISSINGLSWITSQHWILADSLRYIHIRQFLGLFSIFFILFIYYVLEVKFSLDYILLAVFISSAVRFIFTLWINFYDKQSSK